MQEVLKVVQEFFRFWTSRQDNYEAIYDVKVEKRIQKALNYAEEGFKVSLEGYQYLFNTVIPFVKQAITSDIRQKTLNKCIDNLEDYKKDVEKYRDKFDKKD